MERGESFSRQDKGDKMYVGGRGEVCVCVWWDGGGDGMEVRGWGLGWGGGRIMSEEKQHNLSFYGITF